ncbi:hypothetical protein AMS68_003880 [Peltaster fructicola]|uniref:NADH-ubiquinone oxidoreductase B12 subunit n=1 Tax=Peltaster fructicola TaxID=286661 RepID=A0A6H0XUF3_9PEZI|nr:hypothetical protein AMS68_003880 [Peltaster fructicola]
MPTALKSFTMAPRDLTGFDPKKLAAASGSAHGDPWWRNERWRYTGPFTRRNRFRNPFPGFGIAAVAFAGYMVYEQIFLQKPHGHEDEHH